MKTKREKVRLWKDIEKEERQALFGAMFMLAGMHEKMKDAITAALVELTFGSGRKADGPVTGRKGKRR